MANTIPAQLQRQVILQTMMRSFKQRILPILAFSVRFNDVPLEGTDKLEVPYFPLETAVSTDFVPATGYVMGSTLTDFREVTINKRKYQSLAFGSSTLRRQPAFNPEQLMIMKAEKLAQDVLNDIFSIITAANYGAADATLTGIATTAFDLDDVVNARNVVSKSYWPDVGRSLVLDSDYDANLMKDARALTAQNYGSSAPIQQGRIPQLVGFDYRPVAALPQNTTEKIAGFAAFPSAVLVGFSPIRPADEVMRQLSAYDIVTDPDTGLSLEYRRWGAPDMDEAREVVECNYGYGFGEKAALKLITRP